MLESLVLDLPWLRKSCITFTFFYSFSKRAESVLGIVPRIMRFANVFQLSRYSYNHLEIIFLFI